MPQYTKHQMTRLELHLSEIGLSVRTTNALEERGIFTVLQLLSTRQENLLEIPNFGDKTLVEVFKALRNLGFYQKGLEPSQEDIDEDPSERRRRLFREYYGIEDD